MLLILNFSTLTFITNARTTMPFARLHSQMVCTQSRTLNRATFLIILMLRAIFKYSGKTNGTCIRNWSLRQSKPVVISHRLF